MPPVSPTSPPSDRRTAGPIPGSSDARRPVSTRPKRRTPERRVSVCLSVWSRLFCRKMTIPTVGADGAEEPSPVPRSRRTETCVKSLRPLVRSSCCRPWEGQEAPSCLSRSQRKGNTSRHVLPRGSDTARGQILHICFFSLFSAGARSRVEKPAEERDGNCTEPDRVRGTTLCRV